MRICHYIRGAGFLLLLPLLLGVVRESPGQPSAGERGRDAAAERVKRLRLQVQEVSAKIRALDSRVPTLRQKVEALEAQVASVQAVKEQKEEPPPEKPQPKTVEFRPPRLRQLDKDQNVAFICRNGRVYVFDLDAYGRAMKAQQPDAGVTLKLDAGDCDVKIEFVLRIPMGNVVRLIPSGEVILKSGVEGETLDQARQAQSGFRAALARLNPDKSSLQFMVFPDSYELFREARSIAWGRKFDLNWIPREVGSTIRVGLGGARAQ